MFDVNSGYVGNRMSKRAENAYENGEYPLSKWTKNTFFDRLEEMIENEEIILKCDIEKLKLMPVKFIKRNCLILSSWHHTSSYFNETDFYEIDIDYVESLDNTFLEEKRKELKELRKMELQEKNTKEFYFADIKYEEWEGSRKWGKFVTYEKRAIIYENKAYIIGENKFKRIDGQHFYIKNRYESKKIPNHFDKKITKEKMKKLKLC